MANEVTRVTADGLVATGTGVIEYIAIAPTTATPTAGLVTIYDSTSETGTILYSEWVFATTPGHYIELCGIYRNGIYVGYDGSLANVSVSIAWRG